MGWWKVQGTEDVVGDEPLDTLGGAIREVARVYEEEWGRRPTKREWELLLQSTLGGGELDPEAEIFCQDGWAKVVSIEFEKN